MTRTTRPRHVALLAAVALVASGCGDETAPESQPGRAIEAAAPVQGTKASVAVPTGELTLQVGAPVTAVSADQTARLKAVEAPPDGTVLPVGMSFDQGAAPLAGVLAFPAKPTTVSVRACGHDYPVGDAYTVGDDDGSIGPVGAPGYYVTLPCAPGADVGVVVSYDGVDQSVDASTGVVTSGRAGTIGDLGAAIAPRAACPTAGWSVAAARLKGVRVDCTVSASYRTPYLPGRGWAEEGQEWVVADVDEIRLLDASAPGAGGATTDLTVTGIEDASMIGGVAATELLVQQPKPREYVAGGTWVFSVPADSGDPIGVDLTYRLDGTGSVHVTGSLALPRP